MEEIKQNTVTTKKKEPESKIDRPSYDLELTTN